MHLSKYTCCIFVYAVFCIAIILLKINLLLFPLSINDTKSSQDNFIISAVTSSHHQHHHYREENQEELISSQRKAKEKFTTVYLQRIDEDIERISSVCEKYNKLTTLERTHFMYSPKHKTLFCWIRKVASTSFTKLFADLRGRQVTRNHYKEIPFLAPENIEDCLNFIDDPEIFKFLAVRHPFERLVSAFRDRIEDSTKYTAQSWIFVPKIFYITRTHLFHFNESIGSPLHQIFHSDRRLRLVPTFKEFITWLLQEPEEQDDPHWRQYHAQCSICQTRFDYVLKLDNYSTNELNYITATLGINDNHWNFPRLGLNTRGLTNFPQTCKYLSSLSKKMLKNLYKRYEIDFEMFDYNYEIYEKCSQKLK